MGKYKRALGIALALAMVVPMAACGKKDNDKNNNNSFDRETMSDEYKNYVYKEQVIKKNEDGSNNIYQINDGTVYAFTLDYVWDDEAGDVPVPYEEGDVPIVYSEATDALAEETASEEETGNAEDIAFDADEALPVEEPEGEYYGGSKATLTLKCYDMKGNELSGATNEFDGDMSLYNFSVSDKGEICFILDEYNYDSTNFTNSEKFSLVCVDKALDVKWQKELGANNNDPDTYYYINSIVLGDDTILAMTSNGVEAYDMNGELKYTIGAEETANWFNVLKLRNGEYLVGTYTDVDTEYYMFDMATGKKGDKIDFNGSIGNFYVTSGKDGAAYDLILSDASGVYGCNISDGKIVKVMDYIASDMAITNLSNIVMEDGENFYATYYNYLDGYDCLSYFEKINPNEVAEKSNIVLGGMWISDAVRKDIVDYNKSQDNYRIIIKDYASVTEGDGSYEALVDNMNNDILTGNMPDIMILNNGFDVDKYTTKGVFEDLNPYLDNDADINREDYLTNVFDAMSDNGKLYAIAPNFYVSTVLAKSSKVGKKTSWTMEEFNEFMKGCDPKVYDFGMITKGDFMYNALWYNESDFIDWSTGKVSFDSPEFVSLLEYTDRYPAELNYESDATDEYWNTYDTIFREDRALFSVTSLYSFNDLIYNEQGMFGEDVAYIGFPSSEGCGATLGYEWALSMSADSKYKDEAWKFISIFLKDDYQSNIEYMFPIKLSCIKERGEKATKLPTYTDDDGVEQEYHDTYWTNSAEIELNPLTQAEVDEFMDYIGKLNKVSRIDEDISNIVNEEAESYYSGQKSAEEAAKVIQSRVKIYVDENR